MKSLLILSLLFGLVLAQRDAVCTTRPQVIGQCPENNLGYTYRVDHGCIEYHAIGCHIMGNFFHTLKDCQAKCTPTLEYTLQDLYFRGMDALGRVVIDSLSAIRHLV
ncbi:uncharacterized protein [Drosophila kikkawai]|uniref:BPTI/Kunitz inhibitor domain-containing protein n=1 Tax=Drosophila kikkawai TaxID=30033 RepID=A0ABM3C6E0_DROKI|nr:uncharacterized protein LOC121502421 [Drosophila kikkawai]